MPFTLSHSAAVLPFFPLARDPILMTALVVGSLSPDFGYYTRTFGAATAAHSLIGSVLICIPAGLLALAFIVFFRKPLLFLMPSRICGALSEAIVLPDRNRLVLSIQISVCIWIGACTHIVWDAFTHKTGWFVQRSPFLQYSAIWLGDSALPNYYVLQQVSTVLGLSIGVIFLLRRVFRSSPSPSRRLSDVRRYAFWTSLGGVSIVGVLPFAWQFAGQFEGLLRFRSFIFQTGVLSGSVFAILFIVSLLVSAWMLRNNTGQCDPPKPHPRNA